MCAPNGIWLDLTGRTHLVRGEKRFCRRLVTFLRRLGYAAIIAVAGTPGVPHALARHSSAAVTVLSPGREAQAITDMPLAALRLDANALVAASPVRPRPDRRPLPDAARTVRGARLGLRAAALGCLCVDAGEQWISLGTATCDPRHLRRMLAMRVERIEPGLDIEAMVSKAPRVEELGATAMVAELARADGTQDIAPLIDQLGVRVGEDALFRMGPIKSDVAKRRPACA